MSLRGPFYQSVAHFRKGGRLRVDGTVPGVQYNRRVAGTHAAGEAYGLGTHGGSSPDALSYDPDPGPFVPPAPTYHPPDYIGSEAFVFATTPEPRFPGVPDTVEAEPLPPSYDDMLAAQELVNDVLQPSPGPDSLHYTDPQPILEATAEVGLAAPSAGVEPLPQLDPLSTAGPVDLDAEFGVGLPQPDMPVGLVPESENAEAAAAPSESLEQIVGDSMPMLLPDELQPDPHEFDPFADPLMRQMMDPFGMPGMGPM